MTRHKLDVDALLNAATFGRVSWSVFTQNHIQDVFVPDRHGGIDRVLGRLTRGDPVLRDIGRGNGRHSTESRT